MGKKGLDAYLMADDIDVLLLHHSNGTTRGVHIGELDSITFSSDSISLDYVVFGNDTIYVVDSVYVIDTDSISKLNEVLNAIKAENEKLQEKLSRAIILENGVIDKKGNLLSSDTTVITSIIPDNFYIQLNDGYAVYAGYLYDNQENFVSSTILQPDIYYNSIDIFADNSRTLWSQRSYFATQSLPDGYGMRLVLKKTDCGKISEKDDIIKSIGLLNGTEFQKWILKSDGFVAAQKRLEQVQLIMWSPKKKIPAASERDYNNFYYGKGSTVIGLPYSSVKEIDKYVPNEVSIRTFMSAVNNPHSLLYTEDVLGERSRSEYGYKYHGVNCSIYYGGVCSSIINYILNLPVPYISKEYPKGDVKDMKEVKDANANNVQPLDVIWNSGHVSIISDILKDKDGNVKLICWAEETRPYFRNTPYTPQLFEKRLKSKGCRVYRYTQIDNIPMPDESEFKMIEHDEAAHESLYNDTICTFAGDYAAFVGGDNLYLNVLPGRKYSAIEIQKVGGQKTLIQLQGYKPTADGYVDVPITDLSLSEGKYLARLIDGLGIQKSKPTHFELVDINMYAVDSGRLVVYNIKGGTPLYLTLESIEGGGNTRYFLTEQDKQFGYARPGWDATGKYIKLFVKADYGIVTKRIKVII